MPADSGCVGWMRCIDGRRGEVANLVPCLAPRAGEGCAVGDTAACGAPLLSRPQLPSAALRPSPGRRPSGAGVRGPGGAGAGGRRGAPAAARRGPGGPGHGEEGRCPLLPLLLPCAITCSPSSQLLRPLCPGRGQAAAQGGLPHYLERRLTLPPASRRLLQANAASTFNILNQEGRKCVGALLPLGE